MKKILISTGALLLGIFLSALPSLADPTNPLSGNYYGTATIVSPAMLGTIDLAFYLDVGPDAAGTTIQHNTSYVILDKTLLFPPQNPPQQVCETNRICTGSPAVCNNVTTCTEVGPWVSGTVKTTAPPAFTLTVRRARRVRLARLQVALLRKSTSKPVGYKSFR